MMVVRLCKVDISHIYTGTDNENLCSPEKILGMPLRHSSDFFPTLDLLTKYPGVILVVLVSGLVTDYTCSSGTV